MAEKAQADAMAMVQSKCVLQWKLRTTCESYIDKWNLYLDLEKGEKQYCSCQWRVQNKSSQDTIGKIKKYFDADGKKKVWWKGYKHGVALFW